MQSKAADVAAYLAEVPEERLAALERLRALCLKELKGYTEGMDYGMPVYKCGDTLVAFASQKQYIALYGMSQAVIERHKAELKGCSLGKGCIRYKSAETMDFDLIRTMMREKLAARAGGCA